MSHTLTSLEFLFTNGGIEVHTHAGPSVLASCVCTSRLNRGVFTVDQYHPRKKLCTKTRKVIKPFLRKLAKSRKTAKLDLF